MSDDIIVSLGQLRARSASRQIDAIEQIGMDLPQREMPLQHIFTDGLYIRQIFIPAHEDGTAAVTKTHKTEYPMVMTQGRCSVFTPGIGWEFWHSPYYYISRPGARRFMVFHEDTIITTFHRNPTNERDLSKLEEMLILPHGDESPFDMNAINDFLAGGAHAINEGGAK